MHRPTLLTAAAAMLIAGTIAVAPSLAANDAAATAAPPPPPPGPHGEHMPPPPPPGPGVVVDRRADGTLHVDVRCPPRDAIKDCAAVAGDLLAKLNAAVQPR